MQNFKEWLDNFTSANQISPNNTFTFTRKDGSKDVVKVSQILDFIAKSSEKEQEKFKASLEKGVEANNLIGYMYQASRYLKLPKEVKQDLKGAETYESEGYKKDDGKSNWKQEQESIKDNAKKMLESLEERLKNPQTRLNALEDYQKFISQFGSLYHYSSNNIALIQSQLENAGISSAGVVKSEKDWNEMGVSVKDSPLKIYVPYFEKIYERETLFDNEGNEKSVYKLDEEGKKIPVLDEEGNPKTKTIFKMTGKVYDASQTDAFEKGIVSKTESTRISTNNINEKSLRLIAYEISSNLDTEITFRPFKQSSYGYFTYKDGINQIHIDSNTDVKTQLATLLHETGHRILHTQDYFDRKVFDKTRRECEAEGFAFVMANQFGLETKSAEYILGYLESSDKANIKDVFDDVLKAVRTFNGKVDVENLIATINNSETKGNQMQESDVREKMAICQEAVANGNSFNSDEASAIACVREFYTAYGANDDIRVQEAVNDIYRVNMSLEDINKIKELTIREMDMDLKEDFDNSKDYTMQEINEKFASEMSEIDNAINEGKQYADEFNSFKLEGESVENTQANKNTQIRKQ
ncbi:TPA: ImmA/IrrE family metallo-endopeptidase [Campylobacter fetus subsp. venerealis]|nr:ImmA/IrrE family metallo-endopeptidase [Campylobacter fetus subsp. venerealis]HDX6311494.1 ImmA/IrrE family metallo-endopeptidase [Campylobacter fetus subsp. venerealis]HDX6321120.1 ImmA/IrrE family metallo-endopeptidase [Campylobacter fetus subsp. venerealis]HDX6323103.1 ImmA/IrrE family metallo-endopeptidase [Campylobacter fetus subsp. venerealis]HDX8135921.1 ImmA/IrrE family metallo-endopeptidase [Campylobacter fetus subsp. venerealis]